VIEENFGEGNLFFYYKVGEEGMSDKEKILWNFMLSSCLAGLYIGAAIVVGIVTFINFNVKMLVLTAILILVGYTLGFNADKQFRILRTILTKER